jgi:hypothetical protein
MSAFEQTVRGAAMSTLAAGAGGAMAYVAEKHVGVNPVLSTFLFISVMSSVLGYAGDILFAKAAFSDFGSDAPPRAVPYSDVRYRVSWLVRSLRTKVVTRFMTLVAIDGMIVSTMQRALMDVFDRLDMKFRIRDVLLGMGVSAFTFAMYVNSLRFNWAYKTREDAVINALVMMWFTVCLMLWVVIHTLRGITRAAEQAENNAGGRAGRSDVSRSRAVR